MKEFLTLRPGKTIFLRDGIKRIIEKRYGSLHLEGFSIFHDSGDRDYFIGIKHASECPEIQEDARKVLQTLSDCGELTLLIQKLHKH